MILKFKKLDDIIKTYESYGCFIKKIDDSYKIFLTDDFSKKNQFDFFEVAFAGLKKEVTPHVFNTEDNENEWYAKFGKIQHYCFLEGDECYPEFVFESIKEKLDIILEDE